MIEDETNYDNNACRRLGSNLFQTIAKALLSMSLR